MPAYEVEHVCALTDNQKDQLVESITRIHSQQFSTPRLFVNVRITDISEQRTYVAGKQVGSPKLLSPARGKGVTDGEVTAQSQPYTRVCEAWSFAHTGRL